MAWTEEMINLLKQRCGEGLNAREIATELGGVSRSAVLGKMFRLGLSTPNEPAPEPAKEAKPVFKTKSAKPKSMSQADATTTSASTTAAPKKKNQAVAATTAAPKTKNQAAAAMKAPPKTKNQAAAAMKASPKTKNRAAARMKASPKVKNQAAAAMKAEPKTENRSAAAKKAVPPSDEPSPARRKIIPADQPLPPQPNPNEIAPEALETVRKVEEKAKRIKLMELTKRTCKWPIGDPATEDFWFCGHPVQAGKPYCEAHVGVAFQPMTSRNDRRR